MNTIALSGTPRKATGTKDAAQLRREKRVPCVLYGGSTNVHFSAEESALRKIIITPEVNGVEIDIEGRKVLALVKDKQFQPVTDRIVHVDFLELDEKKETSARLSLRLKGQATGVRKGGTLSNPLRKLRVKGLPANIPTHLELEVTDLDLNQVIRVADLKFEGLTLLDRAQDVVVAVKMAKKKEEAAAPGAAPAAAPAAGAKVEAKK